MQERFKKVNFNIKDFKYKFKKYYDKRWKKICLILLIILIINSVLFIATGKNYVERGVRKVFYTIGIYTEEIKSIEIESDGWSDNESGSVQIIKTTKWIDYNTAELNITLNTAIQEQNESSKDVIIILDNSLSMEGEKLTKAKNDITKLTDYLLDNSANQVSLITFSDTSTVNSNFTNNKENLLNIITNIQKSTSGNTNYNAALQSINNVLTNYNKDNHDLIVLFITDGHPNIESPNHVSTYKILKEKYPFIQIKGIQYDLGTKIINELKTISDIQYSANINNLSNVLFNAAIDSQKYKSFILEDIINNDYFYIDNEDSIAVSNGELSLTEENNNQKIIWNLNNFLKTGSSENISIILKVTDSNKDDEGFFPINQKTTISYQLNDEEPKKITSTKTPVLKSFYKITYDSNPPSKCNIKNLKEENYRPYEKVNKKSETLSCSGYQFKGWEFENKDNVKQINQNTFIMPEEDIVIRATWTKIDISKSMEGTLYVAKAVPLIDKMLEDKINKTSTSGVVSDTTINFNNVSSDSNGKGLYVRNGTESYEHPIYYYRGAVPNNNVIFANFCWKIVRTTETGGIKLIYNGTPKSGVCANEKDATQLASQTTFNSPDTASKYVGYMYDTNTSSTIKNVIDDWYKTNMTDYTKYLEDTAWCGDRSISSTSGSRINYGAYGRLYDNKTPTFDCPRTEDKYTVSSSNGNGLLTYPVALLTGDEAVFAGGSYMVGYTNTEYYLYTGNIYWLLTPAAFNTQAFVLYVVGTGQISSSINDPHGVRPAISLKSDITVLETGNGTANNPYVVHEEL